MAQQKPCLFCGVVNGSAHEEGCPFHKTRPTSVFHWNHGYADAGNCTDKPLHPDDPAYVLGFRMGKEKVIEKRLAEKQDHSE